MLSGQELSFVDTLMIAASGMTVVMLELILIAVMIVIMSALIRGLSKKADVTVPVPVIAEDDSEIHGVIMSVISAELQVPLEELNFKSLKQISQGEIRR